MNVADIENAILSTFLYADCLEDQGEVYKLDLRAFTSSFRSRVAERINSEGRGTYGFLSWNLEESIKGTVYESQWLDIISKTSLTLNYSKRYHDALLKTQILRRA